MSASRLAASEPVPRPASAGPRRVGGRYRLDDLQREVAGSGVWRGTDEVLGRPVTIWALRAGQPVAREVRDAVTGAARLADPRIARVFDADCASDEPYVVCEWPGGETLDDLLLAALPDPWTAATVVMLAAGALARAHEAGRAHLCLTPRSVRWGPSGLKIVGVGIEAAVSGVPACDPAAADARGLGGLLYATLTGYWPGDGESALPRAPRVTGGVRPARLARAWVPGVLDAITRRTLAPGTGAPITSPAELAAELSHARRAVRLSAAEIAVLSGAPPSPRCDRRPAITGRPDLRPVIARGLRPAFTRRSTPRRAGRGCADSASAGPSGR